MAFKEILVLLVLVHVVGSIRVLNCRGRGKTVMVHGGKMMLSRHVRAFRITGRVRIARRGMAPFRYRVSILKKIRGNRYRRTFCPRRFCNRRFRCKAIPRILRGARCRRRLLLPGLTRINSRWLRVPRLLRRLMRRVQRGQLRIAVRFYARGLYGCFEIRK
ncbi:uncharacterized protein LOC111337297 [Stylophora pistillata]|uniref:uncharacterized protein LOC111337297 n=1 Tax=Stylophora pistillata TaxID=50429 RepID=UPI000C0450BD|nr:uncharacterized protein LOC111337297 [Stylophora pistillata]